MLRLIFEEVYSMKKLLALPVVALVGTLVGPASAGADPFTEMARPRAHPRGTGATSSPDAEEWRQAWQQLSSADQATLTQAWVNLADSARNLTPAQKKRIRAAAQASAERLRDLTPAQKAQLGLQLQRTKQAYLALGADDKAALLAQLADTIDRLKSVTPAQRETLKSLYRRLLGL
jgi:hypothetical protein